MKQTRTCGWSHFTILLIATVPPTLILEGIIRHLGKPDRGGKVGYKSNKLNKQTTGPTHTNSWSYGSEALTMAPKMHCSFWHVTHKNNIFWIVLVGSSAHCSFWFQARKESTRMKASSSAEAPIQSLGGSLSGLVLLAQTAGHRHAGSRTSLHSYLRPWNNLWGCPFAQHRPHWGNDAA